jgi:tagaturonate epimerase
MLEKKELLLSYIYKIIPFIISEMMKVLDIIAYHSSEHETIHCLDDKEKQMTLETYSIGVGDRFGHQGAAQLRALQLAEKQGVNVIPVWNKSNREHSIIGTNPEDTRREADAAVILTEWKQSYHVDADHIGISNVDKFLSSCDFFTLDVADFIGKPTTGSELESFERSTATFKGKLQIPDASREFIVTDEMIHTIGTKYLYAVKEAAKTYQHIKNNKTDSDFIVEVSMDETDAPQTPVELFFILFAIAQAGIPIQTIAPKFSGKFLKGIDYVGDVQAFAQEFEEDILVIAHAVNVCALPKNLKLSVHSGSDKFSLYPIMHQAMNKHKAGLHLKTAGTTWLEELIGLAAGGGDGLAIAKDVYAQAFARREELCKPYASVVEIDSSKLPLPSQVSSWSSQQFVSALQHNQQNPEFNIHLRQMLHVAFKIASEMGPRYTSALKTFEHSVSAAVTGNIYNRHVKPLFLG